MTHPKPAGAMLYSTWRSESAGNSKLPFTRPASAALHAPSPVERIRHRVRRDLLITSLCSGFFVKHQRGLEVCPRFQIRWPCALSYQNGHGLQSSVAEVSQFVSEEFLQLHPKLVARITRRRE